MDIICIKLISLYKIIEIYIIFYNDIISDIMYIVYVYSLLRNQAFDYMYLQIKIQFYLRTIFRSNESEPNIG